jgi:hypothetical protein
MSPDWRALLAAVIEDGSPMEETDYGMAEECRYCDAFDGRGIKRGHDAECPWRRAQEALAAAVLEA